MKNENNIKKIKTIHGFRVNHPHSFANIFYAFLALVLTALPVGILFVPLMSKVGDEASVFTGMNYIPYITNAFKYAESDLPEILAELINPSIHGELLEQAIPYLVLGQTVLLFAMVLMSLISFIYFWVIIFKGYARSAKGVKVLAGFDFFFALLFGLSFIAIYVMDILNSSPSTLFVWYSLIPAGAALILSILISSHYSSYFKNCVQECDIEYHEDENEKMAPKQKATNEISNVVPNSDIPQNISSIGGHAFSENQNLVSAHIPSNISVLGNSAFSNCLKLENVYLPHNLKEIGFNCFFNCASLKSITYAGSKEEWKKIKRGSNWLAKAKTTRVICSDGILVVNPYK